MTRQALFMLGKSTTEQSAGDIRVSREIISLARESLAVSTVALTGRPTPGAANSVELVKRGRNPIRYGLRSLASGRSLAHTKFDQPNLADYLSSTAFDAYIAEHSYMAESFFSSRLGPTASTRLYVNTHVQQSLTWSKTPGFNTFEKRRLLQDEIRVATLARRVACLDETEAAHYADQGVDEPMWLQISLPPTNRAVVRESAPKAVFLGHRDWPPNHEGLRWTYRLWPAVLAKVPDAQLLVVGRKHRSETRHSKPANTSVLGFVEDLDSLLGTCRVIIAPISTGGGVRVKLLEAAARGLPIVSTPAGIGSLEGLLGLKPASTDDELIDRTTRLLGDPTFAAREGGTLYERNAMLWDERNPHRSIEEWLRR